MKQCSKSDPKLITCLIDALHHLRPYLSVGIPEIELPSVEPFRVSSIHFKLNAIQIILCTSHVIAFSIIYIDRFFPRNILNKNKKYIYFNDIKNYVLIALCSYTLKSACQISQVRDIITSNLINGTI